MKNKEKLKTCQTNKEYKVYNLDLKDWGIDCCLCWNCNRGCKRKHFTCKERKGRNKNWKEFRKTQFKKPLNKPCTNI